MEETKRQSSKDVIAANVAALIQQLNSGKSEALTAYLTAMGRFHNYSFGNVLEIARQRPTASRVAGFHAWHGFGRHVRKGEKGIRILAPMIGKRADESTGETVKAVYGFRNVYVFDIEQTDGADLPCVDSQVRGDVGWNLEALRRFASDRQIAVSYDASIAPAMGVSYGGRIAILPGQSQAEEFATLAHEIAHELLHKSGERGSKTVRETEAEATAFIVCRAVGLETGRASCDYIQLYNGDADVLTASLMSIQHAAHAMLEALDGAEVEELAA